MPQYFSTVKFLISETVFLNKENLILFTCTLQIVASPFAVEITQSYAIAFDHLVAGYALVDEIVRFVEVVDYLVSRVVENWYSTTCFYLLIYTYTM